MSTIESLLKAKRDLGRCRGELDGLRDQVADPVEYDRAVAALDQAQEHLLHLIDAENTALAAAEDQAAEAAA